MLKIKNYHRLCNEPVGNDGWEVYFCDEQADYYEIKLKREHPASVTVYLQRNLKRDFAGYSYHFMNKDKSLSGVSVTADYIRNMSNLLTSLKHFTYS